jgi:hypothetical protein
MVLWSPKMLYLPCFRVVVAAGVPVAVIRLGLAVVLVVVLGAERQDLRIRTIPGILRAEIRQMALTRLPILHRSLRCLSREAL